MKKILFVIPSLGTGGTNSSLSSLYPKLTDRYEIYVFPLSDDTDGRQYSFSDAILPLNRGLSYLYKNFQDQRGFNKIIAIWFKLLRFLYRFVGKEYGMIYGRRVVRQIEKYADYDYIVAFQEGDSTSFSTLFRCPNKIAWIHCNYNKYLPIGRTEEYLYSNYNKIVCVSEYTASVFVERYPFLSDRTIAIHNIVDNVLIQNIANEPIDDNRFITNRFTILSVGRFTSVKRFREIPHVAATLKENGVIFVWYVLGSPDNSDELLLFNENLRNFKVDDSVKWLGGKSNPYPYFKKSSLYVCLSESEACPMVFKEAQVFGLPIVSTDFPSAKEFIKDGEGIISTLEMLPNAIIAMVERINNGFCFSEEIDNDKAVLEKVYDLFK